MNVAEEAALIPCEDTELVGVLHRPATTGRRAVVVVVGGPQYRVGSHRQFVLLARHLAANGTAVLRFDYRGMGDSGGTPHTFEDIDADIRSAVDFLMGAAPQVEQVALWGLCDAASALMMYAATDDRISGLVLLNPWIRTEATRARTELRHYYGARIRDPLRWLALLREPSRIGSAIASVLRRARKAVSPPSAAARAGSRQSRPFPERMRSGLAAFRGHVLLVLSGQDLTAREFEDVVRNDAGWRQELARTRVVMRRLQAADHTFSSREWRDQVASWTHEWLQSW